MATLSLKLPTELQSELARRSQQTGLTQSEFVRLALTAFLAKEDALNEYLSAIERLDERLAMMATRDEQFARAIGMASLMADSEKSPASRQQFTQRIAQIVETIN